MNAVRSSCAEARTPFRRGKQQQRIELGDRKPLAIEVRTPQEPENCDRAYKEVKEEAGRRPLDKP